MRPIAACVSGGLALLVLGLMIHLLVPGEPAPPEEPWVASPTALAEVDLSADVLDGQFVILENREWTLEEIAEAGDSIPDEYPRTWGAGRLVEGGPGSKVVQLKDSESLGYVPTGSLTSGEVSAIERLPRLSALKLWVYYDTPPEDIQRALELPGLRYLATTSSVLNAYPLPARVTALTVSGPPTRWNFPWVTAFECDVDYFDKYGDEATPEPLPTNLDKVELLIIKGWPRKQPLPLNVRRLSRRFLEPASLSGAKNLEWINGDDFDLTGDDGLEVFAQFPWLTSLDLGSALISDAGLEALATASQVEALRLHVSYESAITARGMMALAGMRRLRSLTLSGGISDAMVMGLRGAPALEELNFSREAPLIRGSCFEVLSSLPSLRTFDIRGCDNFTGVGARFLNGLSIKVLHDFGRRMTPEGCREVIQHWPSPHLEFRWCDHLSDEAFDGLENALRLRSLDLAGCDHVTRVTLNRVLSLVELESLVLPDIADVDDDYLSSLSRLTRLKLLDIGRNENVTERGLLEIVKLPSVETLRINSAGVTARVLKALQQCHSLKQLELPTFYSWDGQYTAAWELIDARPDVYVYARDKGNPYDPKEHPKLQTATRPR